MGKRKFLSPIHSPGVGGTEMNTRDPNTYLRGEACYQAKLTEANVIDARKRVKSGASLKHVAERLGIKRKTLADAVNGRTWKHLAAAALVIGMTTAAHAQSWIIVMTSNNALAYKPIPAVVDQNIYSSESQCWYNKGQWEGILAAKGGNYAVWCANVPGLIATK